MGEDTYPHPFCESAKEQFFLSSMKKGKKKMLDTNYMLDVD
jgi:hypothetical protein